MTLVERIAKDPRSTIIKPAVVSVGPVPVHPNASLWWSQPELLRAVAKEMAKKTKEAEIDIDEVYALATRGLAIGTAYAQELGLPVQIVRKEPRGGKRDDKMIEGTPQPDARVVMADDILGNGGTIVKSTNTIRKNNAEPIAIAVSMNASDINKREEILKKTESLGIQIISAFHIEDLVKAQIECGTIPAELAPFANDFIYKREELYADANRWHEIIAAYNKLGIKIPPEVFVKLSEMFPRETFGIATPV